MLKLKKIETIMAGEIDQEFYNAVVSDQFGNFLERLIKYYAEAKQRESVSGKEGLAYSTLLQIYDRGYISRGEFEETIDSYSRALERTFCYTVNGTDKNVTAIVLGEDTFNPETAKLLWSDIYDKEFHVYENGQNKCIYYNDLKNEKELASESEIDCAAAEISDDKRIGLIAENNILFENIFDDKGQTVKRYYYNVISD